MCKIVEHSKEFTKLELKSQSDKMEGVMEDFKLDLMQDHEIEKNQINKEFKEITDSIKLVRDDFNNNDRILETNITELTDEFK